MMGNKRMKGQKQTKKVKAKRAKGGTNQQRRQEEKKKLEEIQ